MSWRPARLRPLAGAHRVAPLIVADEWSAGLLLFLGLSNRAGPRSIQSAKLVRNVVAPMRRCTIFYSIAVPSFTACSARWT